MSFKVYEDLPPAQKSPDFLFLEDLHVACISVIAERHAKRPAVVCFPWRSQSLQLTMAMVACERHEMVHDSSAVEKGRRSPGSPLYT